MSTPDIDNIKLHEEYFFRDGNVYFLVEKTLFRLHRHFFERESDFFRAKLNPSPEGENGSPNSPYKIPDVKSEEFADLVWVWYNPKYSYAKQEKRKWLNILHLAAKWRFHEIQELAVRHLEKVKFDPIEKIALYKKYAINNDLLLTSYMSLCKTEKLPSPQEGEILTMGTVLRLANAREQILLRASDVGCRTPTMGSAPADIVETVVQELFGLTPHSNDETFGVGGQTMNNGNASHNNAVDTAVVTVKEPTADGKGKVNGGLSQGGQGNFRATAPTYDRQNNVGGKGKQRGQ